MFRYIKIIPTFLLALFTFFLTQSPAYASVWSLEGSSAFSGSVGVTIPITDLQIGGGNPTDVIPVRLRVTNGSLSMGTTTGLTFTGPTSGATLHFSGTRSDLNTALLTLGYTRGSAGSDTLEASLVEFGEVFFEENGHLYKYISFVGDWIQAKADAESQELYGATGYLTTITSANENEFVRLRLSNAGWMGASDTAVENEWRWATGPENGTQFWQGLSNGSVVGGMYANWGTGEPNNSGNEDCGQFLAGGSGKWNDLPCTGFSLPGYVVEFGATGDMPEVEAKNISITTVAAPTALSFSPLDNATSVSPNTTLTINFSQQIFLETGEISIRRGDTDALVQSIPVANLTLIGGGTGVEIDLLSRLEDMTEYYIQVPSTAFRNAGNNFYSGIDSKTVWNFTTGDETAPILTVVQAIPPTIYTRSALFRFSTNEFGTYNLSSCNGDPIIMNHETVEFLDLSVGTTYECTFSLNDSSGNTSNSITIGPFKVSSLSSSSFLSIFNSPFLNDSKINTSNQEQKSSTPLVSEKKNDITTSEPFLIDMREGSRISDVRRLQQFLKDQGTDIYPEGRITGFFGPLTHRAVVRFQEKYQDDILSPINSVKGTGIVGVYTRKKINTMIGAQ